MSSKRRCSPAVMSDSLPLKVQTETQAPPVHVVDVLDAPRDSTRSATKFVLGTEGLRQQMEEYSEAIHWSLYCLGTWHSHLFSSGPSTTDLATAKMVSRQRVTPFIFLIHTPAGLRAYLEDFEDHKTGAG